MPLSKGEVVTLDRLEEVGEAAFVALQDWDYQAEPERPKRPRGALVSMGVTIPLNEVSGDLDIDNASST